MVYYFPYFLVGAIFYSNQHIFTELKNSKTVLAIGILAVLAFLLRVYSDYLTLGDRIFPKTGLSLLVPSLAAFLSSPNYTDLRPPNRAP
jgi:hypothetical protein